MDSTLQLDGYRYFVKIFGCQMNKHDGERVAGMLDALGALPADDPIDADIVVYMTCCVREAADVRLYGQVASLKNTPAPNDRRIVAVGGCIGQRDGEILLEKLSNCDIVFGTHTIAHLPSLLASVIENGKRLCDTCEEDDTFSTDLPSHREHTWHAWVPITTGCNNFCSYCIVPYVRGREKSRPFEGIVDEIQKLEAQGVQELTFLGQNVNSYGRDLYGAPRFSELLDAAGKTTIPRIRFATSHPKDLSLATIDAMAHNANVMPQLHLPVQSGSDRILAAMNRHYTSEQYLDLIARIRAACGDIALSTDIIVGFPGETEEDFLETMRVVKEVGYGQAFTFIYSKREGTPAARIVDDTPHEIIQDRFDRLVALVQECAYTANQPEKGTVQRVLVEGLSHRDENIIMGRSPKNQVVHAPLLSAMNIDSLVGAFVDVKIDVARTWYLSGSIV